VILEPRERFRVGISLSLFHKLQSRNADKACVDSTGDRDAAPRPVRVSTPSQPPVHSVRAFLFDTSDVLCGSWVTGSGLAAICSYDAGTPPACCHTAASAVAAAASTATATATATTATATVSSTPV
jgi:hypothetical protein